MRELPPSPARAHLCVATTSSDGVSVRSFGRSDQNSLDITDGSASGTSDSPATAASNAASTVPMHSSGAVRYANAMPCTGSTISGFGSDSSSSTEASLSSSLSDPPEPAVGLASPPLPPSPRMPVAPRPPPGPSSTSLPESSPLPSRVSLLAAASCTAMARASRAARIRFTRRRFHSATRTRARAGGTYVCIHTPSFARSINQSINQSTITQK